MASSMTRHLYTYVTLALVSLAIPLRAAGRPHAGRDSQGTVVWTNDELDKLHTLDLISIVGRTHNEELTSASPSEPYLKTQDPNWYAAQAENLRDDLERRRTRLQEYRQALDNARSQGRTAGGLNLDQDDVAITPDAGVAILQQRVNEAQTRLDALEDLARHNGIPPGTLRG
jgi:hypothetical protein